MLAKERHAAIVSQFERWCSAVRGGQPFQGDDVSASSPDEQTPLTFESLWIRWEREAKPAPSTVSTWWGYVLQFQRHLGHDDPRRVTPDDVVAWKDALLARGLTSVRDGHTEPLKGDVARRCGEGKIADVWLGAALFLIFGNDLLDLVRRLGILFPAQRVAQSLCALI